MGQGVYTAVAMILAEELDGGLRKVMLEAAPPSDKLYGNPAFGIQVTGNSNSIRAFWKPLRKAGATARAMLIEAAARHWNVDPAVCTATADGAVIHAASDRRLSLTANSSMPPARSAGADGSRAQGSQDFTIIGKAAEAPRHA